MAYTKDFREKVLKLKKREGLTLQETATCFDIGTATVTRWLRGSPLRLHGITRKRKIDKSALLLDVQKNPDADIFERAMRFGVCNKPIWQALKSLASVIKKTLSHPKASVQARTKFQNQIEHYESLSKPIIYIDESGFAHDMPRTHGYAPKGQRCHGKQDWGAKGRTNVI